MKKNDDLRTPAYIYKALGRIDLDPCAGADTNIGIINYALERNEDGLSLEWQGLVFCNPPFSEKEKWIDKMIQHGDGILLLPERGSAPWCGPLVMAAKKYFVMGKKINFEGGSSSNNLGSILVPFGKEAVKRIHESGHPGHFNNVEYFRSRKAQLKTK